MLIHQLHIADKCMLFVNTLGCTCMYRVIIFVLSLEKKRLIITFAVVLAKRRLSQQARRYLNCRVHQNPQLSEMDQILFKCFEKDTAK